VQTASLCKGSSVVFIWLLFFQITAVRFGADCFFSDTDGYLPMDYPYISDHFNEAKQKKNHQSCSSGLQS